MPLYTFVFEFAGGTYVSQVTAPSLKSAVRRWVDELPTEEIDDFGPSSKVHLGEEITAEPPNPVEGMSNVWCATALVRGKLALINIIRTSDA